MQNAAGSLKVVCCALSLWWVGPAHGERVSVDKPLTQFAGNALGGIRTVVRYETAAPDRRDTAILFLAAPNRPDALPMEIQVLNAIGIEQHLIDSEGADCTLAQVALFQAGKDLAVIAAIRVFDAASFSQADPGPMDLQVYQLEHDGNAGRSAIVFRAQGKPTRSKPLCATEDVERAIDAAARSWRPSAIKP